MMYPLKANGTKRMLSKKIIKNYLKGNIFIKNKKF